jgi:23S rRNA (cytosine1962-C5)-methyltransferase
MFRHRWKTVIWLTLLDERGKFLAWGTYSAKSHVAFRVLTLQDEPVDKDFFANRLQKALEQRKHLWR